MINLPKLSLHLSLLLLHKIAVSQHSDSISMQDSLLLYCRLENLTEYDCFAQSFIYLADHLPRHDLLVPFLNDALTEPIEQIDDQMKFFKSVQELNLSAGIASLQLPTMEQLLLLTGRHAAATVDVQVEQELSVAEPDTYPCVLAVCGSGFLYMKVR